VEWFTFLSTAIDTNFIIVGVRVIFVVEACGTRIFIEACCIVGRHLPSVNTHSSILGWFSVIKVCRIVEACCIVDHSPAAVVSGGGSTKSSRPAAASLVSTLEKQ
jgi:hypothetical protein